MGQGWVGASRRSVMVPALRQRRLRPPLHVSMLAQMPGIPGLQVPGPDLNLRNIAAFPPYNELQPFRQENAMIRFVKAQPYLLFAVPCLAVLLPAETTAVASPPTGFQ